MEFFSNFEVSGSFAATRNRHSSYTLCVRMSSAFSARSSSLWLWLSCISLVRLVWPIAGPFEASSGVGSGVIASARYTKAQWLSLSDGFTMAVTCYSKLTCMVGYKKRTIGADGRYFDLCYVHNGKCWKAPTRAETKAGLAGSILSIGRTAVGAVLL